MKKESKKKSIPGISKKTLKTMDRSMKNLKQGRVSKPVKIKLPKESETILVNEFVLQQHYALRALGICIQPIDNTENEVTIYIKKPCKLVISLK